MKFGWCFAGIMTVVGLASPTMALADTWILSDGESVSVPTRAQNLNTFSIVFRVDKRVETNILAKQNIAIAGGFAATAVLSVYDYVRSDLGSFREAYLVLPC